MNLQSLNPVSLAFIGDAVYSLYVREYYVIQGYRQGKKLQELSKNYVSAAGQSKVYRRLSEADWFTQDEKDIFRQGRNHIGHIPRNGDRCSYEIATGIECLCGYWYLFARERLKDFFEMVFQGGIENE